RNEGLQELNLAHMGDAADGKARIPGEETQILAHQGDISETDPAPDGNRLGSSRQGPEGQRERYRQRYDEDPGDDLPTGIAAADQLARQDITQSRRKGGGQKKK